MASSDQRSAGASPALPKLASAFALLQGSTTQWNAACAVTVGHIPAVSGTAYWCSSECDLVFFPHPATGTLPAWRHPRSGERLTAVGVTPGNVIQSRVGTDACS